MDGHHVQLAWSAEGLTAGAILRKHPIRSAGASSLTEHIRPKWTTYMQNLQQVACRNNGYALIRSTLLVDENGEPVYWVEPSIERIEPRRSAGEFIGQMLGLLEYSNKT